MPADRVVRTIRSVVACAVMVTVAAGCGGAAIAQPPPSPEPPPDGVVVPGRPGEVSRVVPGGSVQVPAPAPATAADVRFVAEMVPHHRQALEMSALAPARASDPRVRAIAARIAGAQGPEVEVFEAWLARHGEAPAEHGAHPGHTGHAMPGMASAEQMAALAATSGPAFDATFLDLMIAHHAGALTMVDRLHAEGGTDVDVSRFADDVVATQSAEISRMRALRPA